MRSSESGSTADQQRFDRLWNAHRRRMLDVAFRMLLDVRDAEDVVQEAFTRLARTDLGDLDDPEGWLVVVTGRLCLDRLRARRRRPTDTLEANGEALDARAVDPSDHVSLVDNVTLAMHAVLERLSPAERTSFVLHDVFQYPFEEVAAIVGRSAGSCRQLASRARQKLRTESPAGGFPVDVALQRAVGEQFVEACASGDFDGLLSLLDPEVEGSGDVGAGHFVGANRVARGILRYLGPRTEPTLLHLSVGDRIGIVGLEGHEVFALVLLTLRDGRIVKLDALAGPGPRAAVATALGLG
jgi:RNA polymerase sigma-70 factor (ECF subfamily)